MNKITTRKKRDSNKGRISIYLKKEEFFLIKELAEDNGEPLPTYVKKIVENFLLNRKDIKND